MLILYGNVRDLDIVHVPSITAFNQAIRTKVCLKYRGMYHKNIMVIDFQMNR